MDLLMVRDWASGWFVYVEQMERRRGKTPWEYTRRSVRQEGQIRILYPGEAFQILVGRGTSSVEEFLKSYPEYRLTKASDG